MRIKFSNVVARTYNLVSPGPFHIELFYMYDILFAEQSIYNSLLCRSELYLGNSVTQTQQVLDGKRDIYVNYPT